MIQKRTKIINNADRRHNQSKQKKFKYLRDKNENMNKYYIIPYQIFEYHTILHQIILYHIMTSSRVQINITVTYDQNESISLHLKY